MKTRKMRLIAMAITLAAVMTGVNAEAQRRETHSNRNDSRKESRQLGQRKNDRYSYSKLERRSDRSSSKREYRKPERNYDWNRSQQRDHREYRSDRRYEPNRDSRWNRNERKSRYYSEKYRNRNYRYDRRYEYRHPKYGHVYKRFYEKPLRIRHHHHGDYYFYGGHYYRHYHGVGYVRVEFPRHLVFDYLPFHCDRVWIDNHLYYRYGDLIFERCAHGYQLAPRFDIHFSAHF